MANTGYYVSSAEKLGLRTNAKGLKWSWGVGMPPASSSDFESCAVRLNLDVDDAKSRLSDSAATRGKYHYFDGLEGEDTLYYRRTLLGGRQLQFRLDGLSGADPVFTVNRDYMRFVTHRFMNLHSAGYILTDIAALKLLHSGLAPVHCSAFAVGCATVLVLAPPNTGKTLTAMMACLEGNAEYLAEDLAITNGKELFSVPWTSTFRYYERVHSTRRSMALNRATALVPALELLSLGSTPAIDTLLRPDQLVTDRKISHVVVLERGDEEIRSISVDEAHRKAVNLNRYEFNYVKAPTLVAYEFFNPSIDLDGAARREREILFDMVTSASHRLVVRTPDPTHYAPMLLDFIGRG